MPTIDRLKMLLDYDPVTGVFRWNVARCGIRVGDVAGSMKWKRNRYHRVIIIDGKEHNEHRLAWLFAHGEWPPRPVIHINGDRTDNRATNLTLVEASKSPDDGNLTVERIRELLAYDPATGSFAWRVAKARRCPPGSAAAQGKNSDGYPHIRIDGHYMKAHRLAWVHYYGCWPSAQIDHINGDRADNRIANLREATRRENSYNRKRNRNNKSGHRGVYWHTNEQWCAQIRANGVRHHLGFFDSVEAAAAAYREASARLHGKFGRAD